MKNIFLNVMSLKYKPLKFVLFFTLFFSLSPNAKVFEVSTLESFKNALTQASANNEHNEIILSDNLYNINEDNLGHLVYQGEYSNSLTISSEDTLVTLNGNNGRIFENKGLGLVVFENINFVNSNHSDSGSAIKSFGNIELINCNFELNKGYSVVFSTKKTKVISSDFTSNEGRYLLISYGSLQMTDVKFNHNKGEIYSIGGTYNNVMLRDNSIELSSSKGLNIESSLFVNNFGHIRGYGGNIKIENTLISDNESDGIGFLWFDYNVGSVEIHNSIIKNNLHTGGSEFFQSRGSSTLIVNSRFTNNTVTTEKPLIKFGFSQPITIINSTFADNNSGLVLFQGEGKFVNSVFDNNVDFEITSTGGAEVLLSHSFIDKSKIYGPNTTQGIVHTEALKFNDTSVDDYSLANDSILLDTGTNVYQSVDIPTYDLMGVQRPIGCAIDIGAYESSQNNTNCVDTDGDGIVDSSDIDDDNDGVDDIIDLFPFNSAESTDLDLDGVGDTADAYPLVSIGDLTDTDSDGAPDTCDSACIALGMSADLDDDNDGYSDEYELNVGSDPLDGDILPINSLDITIIQAVLMKNKTTPTTQSTDNKE